MAKSDLRNNMMRNMIAPQAGLENNPKAKLIPLNRVMSNPFQVRQDFDSSEAVTALRELSEDIRKRGILQPLVVRPMRGENNGKFEIVAGERRYRAAQLAELGSVPAIVEDYSDEEAQLVSLTENLQRRDLNFKEEVEFLAQLEVQRSSVGRGGDTDLAQLIHKSRTYVAKRLKLAYYPDLVSLVVANELSINQAYEEAIRRDKIDIDTNGSASSAKGNSREGSSGISRSFKARLVPFVRVRDAVLRLETEVDKLPSDERAQLKEELELLEQEVSHLRERL